MTGSITYRSGSSVLIVGPRAAILIREPADAPRIARLWRALRKDHPASIVAALTEDGLESVPNFILVRRADGRTAITVRGLAAIADPDSAAAVRVTDDAAMWAGERSFTDDVAVLLGDGEAAGMVELPIVGGIAMASAVRWPGARPAEPIGTNGLRTAHELPVRPPVASSWSGGDAAPSGFASLGFAPADPLPAEEPSGRRLRPLLTRTDAPSDTGWAAHRAAEPGLPAFDPPPSRAGDHDDRTRPRTGRPSFGTPVAAAPRFTAVRCDRGHLTNPTQARCRVCGEMVSTAQPPFPVDQPELGVLRVRATGRAYPLRSMVAIGRDPRGYGADALVIQVDGDAVSGQHVEISVRGWDVEIVDMSSNGTRVSYPDRLPQELERGRPTPIFPGALIDLAGDATVAYEVPR